MQKYQSVQVLRAIAVVAVVFFHFSGFRVGRSGVDLFFCISGFVMAGQMKRKPRQFVLDRFTRIYPPFLAALALALIVSHPAIDLMQLARSLLLYPNYHRIYLYPAWSLSYEAMFYAACVAAMFVGGRVVIVAFVAMLLLRVPFVGSAFVLEFLAGFCIARRAWLALPLLLIAAGVAADLRVLSYGPPAALLLWVAVHKEAWFRHRWWQPIALVGDASYAIYLTHATIGWAAPHASLLWILYACLGGGVAFHFLIEKPLVRSSRRLLDRALGLSPVNADLAAGDRGGGGARPADCPNVGDARGVDVLGAS